MSDRLIAASVSLSTKKTQERSAPTDILPTTVFMPRNSSNAVKPVRMGILMKGIKAADSACDQLRWE